MRTLLAIAACVSIGACSLLDEIDFGGPRLDPNKVYVGSSRLMSLRSSELDRYGCVNGPLLCEHRGVSFDCRCP